MPSYRAAITHLKKRDPKLAAVIDAVGPCRFEARAEGTHYEAVARAIVFQQLSGKAASTIHKRFHGIYGDRAPEPGELLTTDDEALRGVGLSRQKIGYLRDLSERVASGDVPLDEIEHLSDDDAIAALTRVKGIGRWTAQMFLMFRLGRPDILPDLDLGIQKGIQLAYRKRKLPTPKDVLKIGAPWAPWRTIASWYLWRSLDNDGGQLN